MGSPARSLPYKERWRVELSLSQACPETGAFLSLTVGDDLSLHIHTKKLSVHAESPLDLTPILGFITYQRKMREPFISLTGGTFALLKQSRQNKRIDWKLYNKI